MTYFNKKVQHENLAALFYWIDYLILNLNPP
jgi:hypothetical protein